MKFRAVLLMFLIALAGLASCSGDQFSDDLEREISADLAAAPTFPLRVSSNGRYLEDSAGVPFPILGDSTWSIEVNTTESEWQTYFADRAARGVNTLLVNAIEHKFTISKPPKNSAGDVPFTQRLDANAFTGSPNGTRSLSGTANQFPADPYTNIAQQAPDFTFPNGVYWDRVDAFLNTCAQNGVMVLLAPAYVGYGGGDEGFMAEMVANGAVIGAGGFAGQPWANNAKSKMWNYGAWLGNRYKTFKNIVWVHGGDYGNSASNGGVFTPEQKAAVNDVFAGLKSVSGQQSLLHTGHWSRVSLATDVSLPAGSFDLEAVYNRVTPGELGRLGYSHTPTMPAFQIEDLYESDPNAGKPHRRFEWWAMLSNIGGYLFGNEPLWRFGSGWSSSLNTTLAQDAGRLNTFMRSYEWWKLVPSGLSGMKNLVTAGGGTASPQSTNYVAAAATPDRSLLIAYVPPAHVGSITIDMTALSGSTLARWFDPTNAAYTTIGTFANTGTRAFTPSGNNAAGDADWVLVLTASSVPNSPPTVVNPAQASANPTTGTPVALSVLGADDGGEANLVYTWSTSGSPPGPVAFGANGTNAAKASTATFSVAGTYTLRVTIADTQGASTTSSVNVVVAGGGGVVATKINFQAAATTTPAGYLADVGLAYGDRGNGLSYGWNTDNTVNARERNSGSSPDKRYDTLNQLQRPTNPNAFWEIGLANGTYLVRIVAGDPSFTDSVHVLRGEATTVVSGTPSASQLFIDGSASVTVTDGRLTISPGSGGVNSKINFIEITPTGGSGSQAPTIATPAAAAPNTVTGKTNVLSVLGADDGGEAALTYTWATTGAPPASVSFSSNGTNASKKVTATFNKAGGYTIQVTVKDATNATATSQLNVTVNQTLTSVLVSPSAASVAVRDTRAFSATGRDQFATTMTTQPSFAWTTTGGGTISASGLFTAGSSAGGPFSIRATSGGAFGSAQVTVTATP